MAQRRIVRVEGARAQRDLKVLGLSGRELDDQPHPVSTSSDSPSDALRVLSSSRPPCTPRLSVHVTMHSVHNARIRRTPSEATKEATRRSSEAPPARGRRTISELQVSRQDPRILDAQVPVARPDARPTRPVVTQQPRHPDDHRATPTTRPRPAPPPTGPAHLPDTRARTVPPTTSH